MDIRQSSARVRWELIIALSSGLASGLIGIWAEPGLADKARHSQADAIENLPNHPLQNPLQIRVNESIVLPVAPPRANIQANVQADAGALDLIAQDPTPEDAEPAEEAEAAEDAENSESAEEGTEDANAVESAPEGLRIVVTAEKTPEEVQSVPLSITVFTEEQIEDANIRSLDNIADNTPNFTFFPGGANRTAPFYSVRGITNFNLFSRDAVGFFVDDVPYSYAGFIDQDLIDLERVEVLRGPQNTLYGRSSLGGVVNVTSRRPSDEFEFRGSTSYGSYETFDAQLSVSGPIVEDELGFRLSGRYGTQDGFVENTFLDDDVDGGSDFTGQGQLAWTPSDKLEVLFNASVADYREGAEPFVIRDANDDPFETEQDFNGFNDLVSNAQSLRIAYDTPDIRVTSITAHRFSSQIGALDQDATTADIEINAPNFASRVFTQEVRVQSPEESDRLQWIVGGYYEASNFDNDRAFIRGLDTPPTDPLPSGRQQEDGETNSRTLATFGQVSYGVTDALTLTAGLRYEDTDVTTDYAQTFTSTDGLLVLPLQEFSDLEASGSELLPRFVIDYQINPNLLAYGSITRGYRPPGASFSPINEDTAVFDGETSWNYELGVKSSWLDDRLIVNLSGFINEISDFQFPSLQDGNLLVDNADTRVIGSELEIIARPLPGLDLIAGLGLLNSEFRNGNDAFTGAPLEGNRTPFAPSLTYNVAAQYRSDIGILGRLELVGFGNTFFDDLNTVEQDSFALVNARLGYEFDDYGLYVFANNLFDTEYVTQAFNLGTNTIATFGAPRTVGVQMKARF
ncbi:MAG: TonB-dependent receptor [Cyanobacteria bacterium P01_F01_bin.150]